MTFTIIYFEFIDESTFDVKYKVNWLSFYHIKFSVMPISLYFEIKE